MFLGNFEYINDRLDHLSKRCVDSLISRGFDPAQIHTEPFLHMRYDRTDCTLLCSSPTDSSEQSGIRYGAFDQSFVEK